MLKRLWVLLSLAALAACASQPPPEPEPETAAPPVEISEAPEPGAPATAAEPAAPAQPAPDVPYKPMQTDSGQFRISIASLDSAEGTAKWVGKAESAGYRTEVLAVEIDGKTWHRVLLPGYATLADAQAALPIVQQELGAPGAWVTSRRRAPAPAGAGESAPPPPPAAPEAEPTPAQPQN